LRGKDWRTAAELGHAAVGQSAGNGSVMRIAPIGIAGVAWGAQETIRVAFEQSRLTHWEDGAGVGAAIAAELIRRTILTGKCEEHIDDILLLLSEYPFLSADEIAVYGSMLAADWNPHDFDGPTNGSVWTCLAQAVWAVRHTNSFADAFSPAWDRDSKHLYFLASTELALGSGWANTSSQNARPEYEAYVINLRKADLSPFKPTSDEEEVKADVKPEAKPDPKPEDKTKPKEETKPATDKPKEETVVTIDFENIDRRTIPLPIPKRNYGAILAGPSGTAFVLEFVPNKPSVLHKFTLESKEAKEFATGLGAISISQDGK
jgi:hypothetical protein